MKTNMSEYLKSEEEMLEEIENMNLDEFDEEAMQAAIADMEFEMIESGTSIADAVTEIDTDFLMHAYMVTPEDINEEWVEIPASEFRDALRVLAKCIRS